MAQRKRTRAPRSNTSIELGRTHRRHHGTIAANEMARSQPHWRCVREVAGRKKSRTRRFPPIDIPRSSSWLFDRALTLNLISANHRPFVPSTYAPTRSLLLVIFSLLFTSLTLCRQPSEPLQPLPFSSPLQLPLPFPFPFLFPFGCRSHSRRRCRCRRCRAKWSTWTSGMC